MYTNELYHHGIKGMHWGVRRYQNPDGTYTSAGKARRNGMIKTLKAKKQQNKYSKKIDREIRWASEDPEDFTKNFVIDDRTEKEYQRIVKQSKNDIKKWEKTKKQIQNLDPEYTDPSEYKRLYEKIKYEPIDESKLPDNVKVVKPIFKKYGNSTNFDRKLNKQNRKERISAAKNSSQLSDDELNYRINRLQKEKQLKDLTNQTVAPGRKRVKDFLARNAETITGSVLAAYVTNKITRKANKPSYDDMVKDEYTRQKAKREAENRLVDEKYYVINKEGKMKRKYETRRK